MPFQGHGCLSPTIPCEGLNIMSKDPAFLFYYQDFAYGTRQMTFEEKGCYIELLCEQADIGHLSIDDIKRALKLSFPIWEAICLKFKKDDHGLFFNEILEKHINKRKIFVSSRIENLKSTHKESHMGDHMENRIRIEKGIKKEVKRKKIVFNKPTIQQVIDYCKEIKSPVDPEHFYHNYESTGWIKANGQPVINWKSTIKTWEKRNAGASTSKGYNSGANSEDRRKKLDAIGTEA